LVEHGLENVNNLHRVSKPPHVEQEPACHGIQKGTGNVEEDNGDYSLSMPSILDVLDKVEDWNWS